MHLIKKRTKYSFDSIHEQCRINLQQHFYYGLNQSFWQNALYNNVKPNKSEGNCSFPNTHTHATKESKSTTTEKKWKMKNIILAIENE